MKTLVHATAIGIFLLHCVVVAIAVFGWLWEEIWPLYMGLIAVMFVQDIALGYCVLSKWEFSLRKKLNPHLRYDYGFTSYYTYKLTRYRLSNRFIRVSALVFLGASFGINVYFHVFASYA